MANIYDVNAAIQKPNVMGNFYQGVQQGQQDKVFGQKQAAYQDALARQQQVQNLAPQIVAGDPQATDQAAAIDPQASAQYADAATQHVKRLQGAMSYIDQQKTPQAKEAAYQQVRPYLAQFGQEPPATFAEAEPKMEAARAQIAALTQQQQKQQGLINVGAGGAIFDPGQGKVVYQNPGTGPKPQLIQTANGYAWATPGAGAQPLTYGGAQGAPSAQPTATMQPLGSPATPQPGEAPAVTAASPMAPNAAYMANRYVAAGMTPEQAASRVAMENPTSQVQIALDPTTGQFKDVSDGSAQIQQAPSAPSGPGGVVMPPAKDGIKAPTGYQFNADRSALMPIPGGPADKGQAASPLGDPNQTGDAYLTSIGDPAMEAMVKAVAEGRMPLPKIYRSGKAGEIGPTQIAQAVAQYDPTYDQADPTSRIKARNDFTSGKSAVQLRQLNTLMGHLGGLADATEKLNNTGYTPLNAVENYLGSQVNTKVSNFQAAARPAAEEFAAILKGGVPSVEEIKAAHDLLNPNKTPDQLRGVIGTMAAQIQSRIAALHAQAQNSLGPFANKVTILTPEGEKALDKLRQKGFIGKFDAGESGGTPDQSAKPATPQYRAVNSMGHAVVWNGSAWVPE